MTTIKEVRTKDYVVGIHYDSSPDSPRNWDNLGKMVCWHNRYNLGDKHDFQSPEDFDLTTDNNVILPLFLYDHSGITISTSSFNCRWDSGQIGWIYVSYEDIAKEYGEVNEETIKTAEGVLESEVKLYDTYVRGDVYGYTIKKKVYNAETNEIEFKHEDSCWGFYGDIDKSGLLDEIRSFDKELANLLIA